jgi:hypothetical protein
MHLLLESEASPHHPYPEIASGGFFLPRGTSPIGAETIAKHIPEDLTFLVHDGNPAVPGLTDLMRGVGWLVVSQRLKTALDAVSADVEYIAINLSYADRIVEGYYIANPRRLLLGIDMNASAVELDSAGIALSVDRLVLDQSRFDGVPLAVLSETRHLVVSPEAVASITRHGCNGCQFLHPASVQL